MYQPKWLSKPVGGLLLDITGVLKDGDIPVPGSLEALSRLQNSGFPFRLVTNETLKSRKTMNETLNRLGFKVAECDMFHPVPALKEILKRENLRPHLLMHEKMFAEFSDIDTSDPNCVVIGDAQEQFTYKNMNEAFRKLIDMKEPSLFSLGNGKYYLDDDGLALDVGAYCRVFEYAVGIKARIVGKPSSEYFLSAVKDLGLQPNEVIMIGDDIESDVGGAQKCGMRGLLVRTGKFRSSDENHPTVTPDGIIDNLKEAVDLLLPKKHEE